MQDFKPSEFAAQFDELHAAFRRLMDIGWPRSEVVPDDVPSYAETLRFFVVSLSQRAEGVSLLVGAGQTWNAETVLRSSYELFARCLKFGYCKTSERDQLLGEYWRDLKEIEDVRSYKNAEAAFPHIELGSRERANLEAVADPKNFPSKTNLPVRKLNQKWSFSQIVDDLSKSGDLSSALVLKNQYLYQSSLAHGGPWAFHLQVHALKSSSRDPNFFGAVSARQLSEAFWFVWNAYLVSLQALEIRFIATDVFSRLSAAFESRCTELLEAYDFELPETD